jgi:hypothetical protein
MLLAIHSSVGCDTGRADACGTRTGVRRFLDLDLDIAISPMITRAAVTDSAYCQYATNTAIKTRAPTSAPMPRPPDAEVRDARRGPLWLR